MGIEAFILTLVITIPTYFLSKWVLEKFDLAPIHKRKKMAVFSAAVLSPLIFVAVLSLWLTFTTI